MSSEQISPGGPTFQAVPDWHRALYVDAGIAGACSVFVGGTVLTAAILWAGGGGFELGLVSALTTAGGLVVLLMRRLKRRIRSNRDLTRISWAAARVAWLPAAVGLLVLEVSGASVRGLIVPMLLVTILAASALASIGNVSWYSWLAELIPSGERGAFLAQRAKWLSIASLLVLPFVGLVLDRGRATREEATALGVVLAVPAFLGAFGWRILATVPSAYHPTTPVRATTRHRRRGTISPGRLAQYTAVWQVAVYLSAPFFQAYAIDRLGMSFSLLLNLQILSQIIPIVTLGWWGQVVDRIGLRVPLGLCSLGKGLIPLFYIFSSREAWWPVVLVYVLSVLDAGITVSNGSALAHLAGSRHGVAQVAHLNLLTTMTASVTPVVAGFLVSRGHIGGLDVLVGLFILSAIGRSASGLILLAPEEEPRRPFARVPVTIPAPEVG